VKWLSYSRMPTVRNGLLRANLFLDAVQNRRVQAARRKWVRGVDEYKSRKVSPKENPR
jgi:hypothetical protein